MYVYIFDHVDHLTDRWHSDGGLVVIASDDDHARALIDAENGTYQPDAGEWALVLRLPLAEDTHPEVCGVHVFPDAGCC